MLDRHSIPPFFLSRIFILKAFVYIIISLMEDDRFKGTYRFWLSDE
jgi:hypothetical protein